MLMLTQTEFLRLSFYAAKANLNSHFSTMLLLSNQHLVALLPEVCGISPSQHTGSPQHTQHCFVSNRLILLCRNRKYILLPSCVLKCGR